MDLQKKTKGNISMILYIYSKCSTCQNALKFLKCKDVLFACKEITEAPPTIQDLYTMLNYMDGNLKKIFNTSGQLYQEMQLNEKLQSMSEESAILLLSQNGMLVKRPFLLGNNFGLLGFKEAGWSKKFKSLENI